MMRCVSLLVLGVPFLVGCPDRADISGLATKKEVDTKIDGAEKRNLANLKTIAANATTLAKKTGSLDRRVENIETRIGDFVWTGPAEKADAGPLPLKPANRLQKILDERDREKETQEAGKKKREEEEHSQQVEEVKKIVADLRKEKAEREAEEKKKKETPPATPTAKPPPGQVISFPPAATALSDSSSSDEQHIWHKERPYLGAGDTVFQVVKDLAVNPTEEWMPTGPYPALYRWVKKPRETTSHLQVRLWLFKKTADGWPPHLVLQWIDVERTGDTIYLRGVPGYKERIDAKTFPLPDTLDPGDVLPTRTPVIVVPPPVITPPVVPCLPEGPALLPPIRYTHPESRLRPNVAGAYPYSKSVYHGGHRAGH